VVAARPRVARPRRHCLPRQTFSCPPDAPSALAANSRLDSWHLSNVLDRLLTWYRFRLHSVLLIRGANPGTRTADNRSCVHGIETHCDRGTMKSRAMGLAITCALLGCSPSPPGAPVVIVGIHDAGDPYPPCEVDAGETKCAMPGGVPGWCEAWDWPDGPNPDIYYCKSCLDIECGGVPGCSAVGTVCQGGNGAGRCPPGCCPFCY
jgi:hypothetical protein